MSKRFTLILTLILFTMLYGATIASANDNTYDEYEEHEIVCNDYVPQILTHYREGESFLTAEVDVEVIHREAAVWKASLHWVSPDGKKGHDMSDSAKRVQIHIPKQGLGTYKMMAEIAIEGCKTEVKVEQNVRFLDIGDTNKEEGGVEERGGTCQKAPEPVNGDGGDNHLIGDKVTPLHDTMNGNSGDDNIKGLECDDVIKGGKGNDIIRGGNGDDDLYGEKKSDKIWGDAGNDYLNGGKGWFDKDECIGGDGADEFDNCEDIDED